MPAAASDAPPRWRSPGAARASPSSPGAGRDWKPADGASGEDHGSHGRFDERAHETSPQLRAGQHKYLVGAATAGAAAGAAVGAVKLLRR